MEIAEFYKRIETFDEIFHTQGEVNHKNQKKQSDKRQQSAKSMQSKGSNQNGKPSKEDANIKSKNKTYLCALCIDLDTI